MATIDGARKDFLTNCWYVAAWDHEINDGTMLTRTILEKPVVLFRGQETGAPMALDDSHCTDQ